MPERGEFYKKGIPDSENAAEIILPSSTGKPSVIRTQFTQDEVDLLHAAKAVTHHPAFRDSVSSTSTLRGIDTELPWAGRLMDRKRALDQINYVAKQADWAAQQPLNEPLPDLLQTIRDNLQGFLPPEDEER